MDKNLQIKNSAPQIFSNFVIFQTATGKVNIDVYFQDETLWLTQKNMAELFEVNVPAISKHLKNIFGTSELEENSVISILETTAEDGKQYKTKYYNLRAILAVGYRVNSGRAIEFRKWASVILEEYIIKGFAMDDERLKQIKHFGKDYFDEMLEAKLKAEGEFEQYRVIQDRLYESDFDRLLKNTDPLKIV